MFEKLNEIDTQALLFLNSFHNDWLDEVMFLISIDKIWIPFYLIIIIFLFKIFNWKKALLIVTCLVCVVALSDRISSGFFKPTFKRYRPTHEHAIMEKIYTVHDYRGGDYGFISSHAANTFGLAMFLFLTLHKKFKNIRWLFLWAGVVSYSRIYLGVHYPLDILTGALLGVLLALIFYQIYLKCVQNIFKEDQINF